MRSRSSIVVALIALGSPSVWAQARSAATSPALNQAPVSTNSTPLPPPPPSSVNPLVNSNNTVPPTPAPATAGLPTPPVSGTGVGPSTQGLPASALNQSRPRKCALLAIRR